MSEQHVTNIELSRAIMLCLKKGIPFYTYRLPDDIELYFGAQGDSEVRFFRNFSDITSSPGFIFSPFDTQSDTPAYYLRGDIRLTDKDGWNRLHALPSMEYNVKIGEYIDTPYSIYSGQVMKMVDCFRPGRLKKAVLSRPITVACNVNVAEIFLQMTTLYPSAFVSLIFIPGKELWLGASPETLLSNRNGMVETMSLAGTKCSDDRYSWGDKEQDEQQIVTDSIKVVLSRLSGGQPDISGTFTRNAGKVSHLCTLFRCHISSEDMDTLLQELHPTPAVGGFPKKDAIQLIHETETYDRRYYAGYLGPVLDKNNFDLFVNLRCMEIFSNCVHVYVGGGITKFSQPQLEWTETEIKSRTMLDLIK